MNKIFIIHEQSFWLQIYKAQPTNDNYLTIVM